MTRLTATLTLVTAMCFTGANIPFGKAIAAEVPVTVFLALRFLVATAVLAVLARGEPGPRLADMSKADVRDLLILAGLGSVLFTVFTLEGAKRTTGMDAGIILATLPAVAALLGLMIRREQPGLTQGLAIGLAVAGLAVVNASSVGVAGGEIGTNVRSLAGNVLVGCAVLCEASFVLASGRLSAHYRPLRLALGVSAAGLVLSLPIGLPALMTSDLSRIPGSIWLIGAWHVLAASVICPVLWYRAAGHVETWLAGLATAAVPVAALAVSAAFLGERIGTTQLAGAGLVIVGIVVGAGVRKGE